MNENPVNYNSNKEDDDPILYFQNLDVSYLPSKNHDYEGIPILQATNEELITYSLQKIDELRLRSPNKIEYVLSLDPYRYQWLRRSKKFKQLAQESFFNLPCGAGLMWMAKRYKSPIPERVSTIRYTMNLLRLAQAKEYTVFIVGDKDEVLDKLFYNLRRSFPRLRLIGKHNGNLVKGAYEKVIEALKKTNPHIVLLGLGFHKELDWIAKNKTNIGSSLVIPVNGYLEILAGKNKKAPDSIETKGLTWFYRAINRPWRWHRFYYIDIWFLGTYFRSIFKKKYRQK